METKKVLLHIKENISVHRQKYLDWDAVEFYWLLEKIYESKELQMSLRKEYGVTEVEAINILNHKRTNVKDYIVKCGGEERIVWSIDFIYGLIND